MPKLKDDTKLLLIQQAATKLVVKVGFYGLKMADVAKEAQLATGTVYIYYANKEELVTQIYINLKNELATVLLGENNPKDTFYQTFRKMWFRYYDYCFTYPEKMLFVEQFRYSGLIPQNIIEEIEPNLAFLEQFILEGQTQGIIKNLAPALILAQLEGAIHELIKTKLALSLTISKTMLETCFSMAWDSVKC